MTVLSRNNDKSYITCLLYACHHRIICFSSTVTLGQGLTRLCLTTCNSRSRYIIVKFLPTFVDEWIVLKNQVKVLGFSLQTSAPVSSRLCRLQKTHTNLLVLDQLRSFQVKKNCIRSSDTPASSCKMAIPPFDLVFRPYVFLFDLVLASGLHRLKRSLGEGCCPLSLASALLAIWNPVFRVCKPESYARNQDEPSNN